MGLDATVYCDCFEKGDLKTAPNPKWEVFVTPEGDRATTAPDLKTQMAFDQWSWSQACVHERGVLIDNRIGNISLVAFLREMLKRTPDKFPIMLTKVVYSGTHCGDFLSVQEVEALQSEVSHLSQVHGDNEEDECFLRDFQEQIHELVECALRVNKPIVF